jgi:hypothetical protein
VVRNRWAEAGASSAKFNYVLTTNAFASTRRVLVEGDAAED